MSDSPDDLDAFIDTGTRLLGIKLRTEWHASVRFHLEVSFNFSHLLIDFPLPDEIEQAAVFAA